MPTRLPITPDQSLILHAGARPDEAFYLQAEQPTCTGWGWDWLFRKVTWDYQFSSYILFWYIRWYYGQEKCDGSRTKQWNSWGYPGYVITTTPKEKFSFRLRGTKPDREVWDNAGGI